MADEGKYTKDGTLDFRNNPANKKITGAWKACPFILGNQCCERLCYYGMSSNLLVYYTTQLNQHSAYASKNLSNWLGTCYVLLLVGAFLADAYLGRYWTIASFSVIYLLGMMLLTLSASVPGLRPTCYKKDECYATNSQTAVFSLALYLVALGSGGMKPCVSSYGADQFDDADEVEKDHKSSFFNWLYFSLNWCVDWLFNPRLDTREYRVGMGIWCISSGNYNCHSIFLFSFLDKATVEKESDYCKGSVNPWRLCTVTQVEELKWIIRLLPVLATGIIFYTVFGQMSNLFLLQAKYMDSRLGQSNFKIPVASLAIFNPISVIFWVPVYDRFISPMARKFTGHKNGLTQLQRIGIGLFISVFGMISAGILEMFRLGIVRQKNSYTAMEAPISIFWQVPQHVIVGCAEVFTNIGQLEFFYEEAPDSMRSLCAALSLTRNALGNYLSSLLVAIMMAISTRNGRPGWIPDNLNYGHLHYFFLLLAVLSVLNLGVFIMVAKRTHHVKTVEQMDVWKNLPRRAGLTLEFEDGVTAFIECAKSQHAYIDDQKIKCPCRKWKS
ncbi:UNVERIFIED_CONTAM: protein NRT1/ PTR FAMILY 8.1 [Sesamum radiatum]|uniref:Protein NRT1/ PTR FAMILY 8.1 n=1 Tax=Sesamum radiatum TaxID=300843 RepID=A0AAW2REA9_SESRA